MVKNDAFDNTPLDDGRLQLWVITFNNETVRPRGSELVLFSNEFKSAWWRNLGLRWPILALTGVLSGCFYGVSGRGLSKGAQ